MRFRVFLPLMASALVILAVGVLAGPQITVPEDSFDFGKVAQRAVVSHTFWIHSTGDDTLRINKVVPGCGCTKAPLADSVLAPGDSTHLDIFFSTKSYRGYVTKRPYLETNVGPEKTFLAIHAHLLVNPDSAFPVILQPGRLDVSQFSETPRRKATFLIQNIGKEDLDPDTDRLPEGLLRCQIPWQSQGRRKSVQGEVIVHEDRLTEEFEHSLTFTIGDNDKTPHSLPVKRMYKVKSGAAGGSR